MYSTPAVECVLGTDEVFEPETHGALPLSYGAKFQVAPVGIEPTTPGTQSMYSRSAVGLFWWRRSVGQSYPLPNERRLPKMFVSGGGRNRTMYSKPAVAVVLLPNEGSPRGAFASVVRTGNQVADC